MKTWRVHKIANNPKIRKLVIPDSLLFQYLFICVGIGTLLISIGISTSDLHGDYQSAYDDLDSSTGVESHYETFVCVAENSVGLIISAVYLICVIVYEVVLAYTTRHVHVSFSENKWIVLSVYVRIYLGCDCV